nr:hypothetical protein Iba_chr04eCG2130 [Ipomoea batatas]
MIGKGLVVLAIFLLLGSVGRDERQGSTRTSARLAGKDVASRKRLRAFFLTKSLRAIDRSTPSRMSKLVLSSKGSLIAMLIDGKSVQGSGRSVPLRYEWLTLGWMTNCISQASIIPERLANENDD